MSERGYYESFKGWGSDIDKREKERVTKTLSIIPNGVNSVIDIGCGDGRVTNKLTRLETVVGLDFSKTALRFVKVGKMMASSTALPLCNESFDLCIMAEVLEHLGDGEYQKALHDVGRIARRYVIVTVPYEQNLNGLLCKCANCGHTYSGTIMAGEHVRSFSLEKLASLFTEFCLKRIIYIGKTHSNPLLKMKQHLGYYYVNDAACPICCSSRQFSRKKGVFYKMMSAISWIIGKKKPVWIACLYETTKRQQLSAS